MPRLTFNPSADWPVPLTANRRDMSNGDANRLTNGLIAHYGPILVYGPDGVTITGTRPHTAQEAFDRWADEQFLALTRTARKALKRVAANAVPDIDLVKG